MRITYAKNAHDARKIAALVAGETQPKKPFARRIVEEKDLQHTILAFLVWLLVLFFLVFDIVMFFAKMSAPGGLQVIQTKTGQSLGRPFDRDLTILILVGHVQGILISCQEKCY
ncbi:Oidioi.mRNA.OKI2018_I69.chr2.g4817.t1.cds [Oikopleura dioica]|uniref:Oidioi.mRNA.OKI2018_I69.chr2.g4817.t1.cds n=1 Tax=Oikopleura dioica TaxID=34765 RepID=A0ABN7T409_OIKDI|nr:Oidioi.mRNA.OKI2018_I69.chr2.g4817.t1.cds [Oikopleura dioica]